MAKKSNFVKMWTGKGYASVNPDYVDKYLKQGWTLVSPSSGSTPSSGGTYKVKSADGSITEIPITGSKVMGADGTVKTIGPEDTVIGVTYTREQYTGKPRYITLQEPEPKVDPYADMLSEIQSKQQELAEAQRQRRIAALNKAKEGALSSLQAEESGIQPMYYDMRNRAAAQSDVGALNFAQFMASRGIQGSAAAMPEIYRNTALQGQIGALNRQEAEALADIARRRSDIESAYQADVAATEADVQAQNLQAYIDTLRAIQAQRIVDLAAQGKTSTGELSLAGQEAQRRQEEAERQAWLSTIGRFSDNYQAEINRVQSDNDPSNDWQIPYLQAARQQKIQQQAEQAAAQAAAASEAERQRYLDALNVWKTMGVALGEIANILGVPEGARTADYDISRINAATSRMNAETSRMNAETSRINAQTSAANLDYKKQQDLLEKSSQRVKQYASQIDNLFVTNQYNDTGQVIGKTFDPATVKTYIQNLHQTGQVTDDEAKQLLALYNFTF